jgi:ADP-ribose pyrophosphatase YjhB (NUDIX family)
MEPGEDPITALEREALEEAGVVARIRGLVGVYSAPYRDDLVLLFAADLVERRLWEPDEEISAIGFFPVTALPEPMSGNTRLRFADVLTEQGGVVCTLSAPGVRDDRRSIGGAIGRSAR